MEGSRRAGHNLSLLRKCYSCPTHILWIRYDLSTEKLHYTTAMLRNDTLPFLTRTVAT